jgi:hypothetical protein
MIFDTCEFTNHFNRKLQIENRKFYDCISFRKTFRKTGDIGDR